jgi:hypothetical protein
MNTDKKPLCLVRLAAWALALTYIWWLLHWSIRTEHYFFADDWDWLYRAALLTLEEQFTLLPRYVLNDRPIGALVFRVLYQVFGLNPAPYQWLCVALHLINITLLAALARRFLRSWWAAAATALAYGTWSSAIEAATWMSAVFDLLCCTFVLLVALTFDAPRRGLRIASVILTYLAMRTKENAIVIPAFLVVIIMTSYPRRDWIAVAKRTLWPHLLLGLVLAACYAPLLMRHQTVETASNLYRMQFTPRAFFGGLYYYTSTMFYGRPWPVGRLIRWTIALAALAAGAAWRTRATLVGLAGFVLFLVGVIFMPNQRQALYLYVPAAFFVLALGGALERAAERLPVAPAWREAVAVAAILFFVAALPHRALMERRSEWILSHTARARRDMEVFRAHVPSLRPDARIAIIGFPADYHVFQTPGCSVLKVFYRVHTVRCEASVDGAGADVVVRYRPEGIEVDR